MSFLQTARTAARGAYVKPWQDKARAFLLIAMLPGLFAAGLQTLALAYHVAGLGSLNATLFHLGRMALMGFIVIPFCLRCLSFDRAKLIFALLQIVGTLLFLGNPDSILLTGLGYVLTSGPYWALYSQRNSKALSRDNHGNEIALLKYLQVLAVSLGTFCGGLFLKLDLYQPALFASGALILIPTLLCVQKLPREPLFERAFFQLGWRKPAVRLSFAVAVLYSLLDYGLPTWMRLIGLSPLSTGTTLALQPILGLLLTPLAGHLIQKGGLGAGRAGGLAYVSGWAVLLFAPFHYWLLLPALALTTVGSNLIGSLELNRWFKRRSVSAIVAREWILAAGRCVALPLIIPFVFLAPPLFPYAGIALNGLFALGSRKKRILP